MAPKAGMERTSGGVMRRVPEITICATFVALGSFTARAPVSVAKAEIGLTPLQSWQLAQAPSNTSLPRESTVTGPTLCEESAGGARVAGRSDDATAGILRREVTTARTSSGAM